MEASWRMLFSVQESFKTAASSPKYSQAGIRRIISVGCLFLFLNSVGTARASAPATYTLLLAWDASPSPGGVKYNLYYGTVSGVYPNVMNLNNVTNATVPGLIVGVTYYFAVTSVDTNAEESAYSNETNYRNAFQAAQLQIQIRGGNFEIMGQGQIGRSYEIQASGDFLTWTNLGSVTADGYSSFSFADTNAMNFPRRFYRACDSNP